MTLTEVLDSELGNEFISTAEELGREPAEVLAEIMQDFIVTVYTSAVPTANPSIIPPRRQRDASDKNILDVWAGRSDQESGLELARRIRDANNRGRHYAD